MSSLLKVESASRTLYELGESEFGLRFPVSWPLPSYCGIGEEDSVLFTGVFFLYIEYSTSNKNRTNNLRVMQRVKTLVLFSKYM